MKLRQVSSYVFTLFVGVTLFFPRPALASVKVNNVFSAINHVFTFSNTGGNIVKGGGSTTTGNASAKSVAVNTVGTTTVNTCSNCRPVSVPEFGLIPGVFAVFASAGSFYLLKRKVK